MVISLTVCEIFLRIIANSVTPSNVNLIYALLKSTFSRLQICLLQPTESAKYTKLPENSNLSVIQGLQLWCQSYTISLTITLDVTRKIACIPWFDATDNYWNPPAAAKARGMVKIVQQPFLTDAPV